MTKVGNFKPVYENQINDVHPPLYYLFLRISMEFTKEHFSKWAGIVLNIIIYAFITIFMYMILAKILKGEKSKKIKALILAFISSITLVSVSNVINIRMYSLATLNILIITFLHIKLLEEKLNYKISISIILAVVAGTLTHYYYIFYIGILYIVFAIKYAKEKRFKELRNYTLTMLGAGIIALAIFPFAIKHIFFGYRGQGVISNLENIFSVLPNIGMQIYNLSYYGFSHVLIIITSIILILGIYTKIKGKIQINSERKEILKTICIPTVGFFLISSIASPWNVLRYISPVCGLIFIVTIYVLYKLLQKAFNLKVANIITSLVLLAIIIFPIIFHMKPELLYDDKKYIVNELSNELNLPTVYFMNTRNERFLDDILLFTMVDNSYIARDVTYSDEELGKIFKNVDTSNGIIVFTNNGENNHEIAEKVAKYLKLKNSDYIQKLNSCDVYHVY